MQVTTDMKGIAMTRRIIGALTCIAVCATLSCSRSPEAKHYKTFASPEEAVGALADAVKAGSVEQLLAILGPDAKELVESSSPVIARRNREVFAVAMREGWRLEDQGNDNRVLVVGNEAWPFPIPLVREDNAWRFDTEAGKDEVIARRIGRNELAAIEICHAYVVAQKRYAAEGHDGKPAGLYARAFNSEPGKQNGLYWPAAARGKRSPLGELVAQAAAERHAVGSNGGEPTPFHGYYYKILTAQGAHASGGAKDYVSRQEMSDGFALIAWPAQYDVTGVMTFVVSHAGQIRQKDLGSTTDTLARAVVLYDPDDTWEVVR
jgi:hypothetical protein